MLKKIALLILVFTVVGVMFVSAQSAADVQAMEQLTKDLQAGKITPAEFERRINELINKAGTQGYEDDTQRVQQQRQQQQGQPQQVHQRTYPGATAGWPPASAFRRYGKSVTQPNIQDPYASDGITYSYKTQGEKLIIYVFRNFSATSGTAGEGLDIGWHDGRVVFKNVKRAFGEELFEDAFADPSRPYTPPSISNRTVQRPIIRVTGTYQKTGTIINLGAYGSVPEYFSIIEIFPDQITESFGIEH